MPINDILSLIERTVRERFGDAVIHSVNVTRDADNDGDAVFRVTVVFDSKTPLDAHKTSGIVRHTRHKLIEREEFAFPIFDFVSKAEAGKVTAAA